MRICNICIFVESYDSEAAQLPCSDTVRTVFYNSGLYAAEFVIDVRENDSGIYFVKITDDVSNTNIYKVILKK
ncbi:MAG: hypothetical protein BWY70_01621 [Bacteroidetes bacterium ADurb.Bin408]|nr:MAG: hypothetical protein BWY70_01621 [Bacteroidetes bacterium ADurb.Bin408]